MTLINFCYSFVLVLLNKILCINSHLFSDTPSTSHLDSLIWRIETSHPTYKINHKQKKQSVSVDEEFYDVQFSKFFKSPSRLNKHTHQTKLPYQPKLEQKIQNFHQSRQKSSYYLIPAIITKTISTPYLGSKSFKTNNI